MSFLIYMAYALPVLMAAIVVARFLARWSIKLDERDHKKWAMNYFKYTEEEYEEYERLDKLRQVEDDKKRRQDSLNALNHMRRTYGPKEND